MWLFNSLLKNKDILLGNTVIELSCRDKQCCLGSGCPTPLWNLSLSLHICCSRAAYMQGNIIPRAVMAESGNEE